MVLFPIKLAWAGLGHMIAHWSIGVIIILACIALEFGAGFIETEIPLIKPLVEWVQKYILFVAVGTALILFGEWLCASDMAARCDAKAAVVGSEVHTQVTKAKHSPTSKARPKWDVDQ